MKTDRYTKVILTIIAVCLVWISLKDFIPFQSAQAQANQRAQNVVITGINIPNRYVPNGARLDTLPIEIDNINFGYLIRENGGIPVRIVRN